MPLGHHHARMAAAERCLAVRFGGGRALTLDWPPETRCYWVCRYCSWQGRQYRQVRRRLQGPVTNNIVKSEV